MSKVIVRPLRGRSDLKAFVDLPFRLYEDDPYWVPMLRMDLKRLLNKKKNAFFEHGEMESFLARDSSGKVVGRISAIKNGKHLEKHQDSAGFFGFFESIDSQEVADALLAAVEEWLLERGLTAVRGPVNPTLNDTAGLLVGGFESQPFVLMTHNPAYYLTLLEAAGFTKVMTMWAYYVHRKYAKADRLKRGVALVRRRYPGLTIRNLDMKRFREEVKLIRDIYNEAWSENWGHVPMTENEFDHLASEMKQVIDPRMAFILEMDGEPVAFSVTIPNMNHALSHVRNGRLLPFGLFKLLARSLFGGIQEVRMPLMGVSKAYHGKGFDAVLVLETIEKLPPLGFKGCEMSWVLDSNLALCNSLDTLGGVRHKEYAILEMPLSS